MYYLKKIFNKIKAFFKRNKSLEIQTKSTLNYCDNNLLNEILLILKKSKKTINNSQIAMQLKNKLDINLSPPAIRKLIAILRSNGNPIIASNKGYILTQENGLIDKYINSRIKELEQERLILDAIRRSV